MIAKRLFDLACVVPALLLLIPVFCVLAVWIKLDSPGPVFFRQERIGKDGQPFRIYKLRTMVDDAERKGGQITVGVDPRITRSGRFLRKFKLDELPQLINVLKGEMSLVGPRPEVPRYVALYPPNDRQMILSVPPGITDEAAIRFRHENALLAGQADPETYYVERILPQKIPLYVKYVKERTLVRDIMLILKTINVLFFGDRHRDTLQN